MLASSASSLSNRRFFCFIFLHAIKLFVLTVALLYSLFFFFNDTPPTEISPLSLHDALPICGEGGAVSGRECLDGRRARGELVLAAAPLRLRVRPLAGQERLGRGEQVQARLARDQRPQLALAAGGRPGQALARAGHRGYCDADPRGRAGRQRAPDEDPPRARQR